MFNYLIKTKLKKCNLSLNFFSKLQTLISLFFLNSSNIKNNLKKISINDTNVITLLEIIYHYQFNIRLIIPFFKDANTMNLQFVLSYFTKILLYSI